MSLLFRCKKGYGRRNGTDAFTCKQFSSCEIFSWLFMHTATYVLTFASWYGTSMPCTKTRSALVLRNPTQVPPRFESCSFASMWQVQCPCAFSVGICIIVSWPYTAVVRASLIGEPQAFANVWLNRPSLLKQRMDTTYVTCLVLH